MKQKLYSILLLVMAMLCLGGNIAWADVSFDSEALSSALESINNACDENGTTFTLTFASSVHEGLTVTVNLDDESGSIKLYNDDKGNYFVAPTNEYETIKAPEDCSNMFWHLTHLASVKFTNFNTENVTSMEWMFTGCTNLTSLDLSGFNTSNVTNMYGMFNYCPNLTSITVGDGWTTEKVTDSGGMFEYSPKLKGQNGTAYSEDHSDATYARVDGDYGLPGYLSRADGKVKIAESLESGASVSFDVTPDVDAVYTFTASDKDATIVIREKGAQIAKPAKYGSLIQGLSAGDTYTVTIENNTSSAMTDLTVSIVKRVIDYITLTAGETTSVGDIAALSDAACKFIPTTSGYYSFTVNSESVMVRLYIGPLYDTKYFNFGNSSCGAALQAGTTYLLDLASASTEALTGVTVTTATVDLPALTLGENSNLAIPACTTERPATIATFTPAKSGTYRFTIDPSDVYIMTDMGAFAGPDFAPSKAGEYEVELEAGNIYALLTFSPTATTGTITVSREVPTIDAATWKEVLAEINGARVEYSDSYTITFADSYSGSDEGISVGTGVKLYGGENSGYNYVVAPTKAGDVIMAPRDCSELFAGLTNLTSLDLSSFNTSNVELMNYMFYYCANLESLTISNFDMSNVKETDYMFTDCNDLSTLTMKSLPYLAAGTFNTQFSDETVNVVLDDNSVVYTGTNHLPEVTEEPTYTREMSNKWGTIVVPFSITYDADNDNYKLYYLTKATSTTLTFTEYADEAEIAPSTPMVIKAVGDKTDGKYTVTLTSDTPNTISTSIGATERVNGLAICGTYETMTIGGSSDENANPYFIAGNQFWRADAQITVKPFRAWYDGPIESGSSANLRIEVADDDTQGIELIPDADGTLYMVNGQCLDLQGRQTATRQGLVIENGRVVWVK